MRLANFSSEGGLVRSSQTPLHFLIRSRMPSGIFRIALSDGTSTSSTLSPQSDFKTVCAPIDLIVAKDDHEILGLRIVDLTQLGKGLENVVRELTLAAQNERTGDWANEVGFRPSRDRAGKLRPGKWRA